MKDSPLDYALLAELNTRPRTTYQARVQNPEPGAPVVSGNPAVSENPAVSGNPAVPGSPVANKKEAP